MGSYGDESDGRKQSCSAFNDFLLFRKIQTTDILVHISNLNVSKENLWVVVDVITVEMFRDSQQQIHFRNREEISKLYHFSRLHLDYVVVGRVSISLVHTSSVKLKCSSNGSFLNLQLLVRPQLFLWEWSDCCQPIWALLRRAPVWCLGRLFRVGFEETSRAWVKVPFQCHTEKRANRHWRWEKTTRDLNQPKIDPFFECLHEVPWWRSLVRTPNF